ncbi:synembryn-A [Chanos chanos]|uniref:Synembryn n=1 Tax=Chanos chanos TaxID=29144 RepID=A0A6J2X058_CHACN|nr:synembryn-A-like [Chanos chanos]
MALDVERIIQCIKQGDQDSVQSQLDDYNAEHAECFFFNLEERERRKQRELEEFRRNKVREYVPDSDSDFEESEDAELILRRRLAAALIWFIRMQLQPGVLRVCLRTLRIISRDRQALAPLVTDTALLTLAHLGGITSLPFPLEVEEEGQWDLTQGQWDPTQITLQPQQQSGTVAKPGASCFEEDEKATGAMETAAVSSSVSLSRDGQEQCACTVSRVTQEENHNSVQAVVIETHSNPNSKVDGVHGVLVRGKRDAKGEGDEEQSEEGDDDGEVWRKEAMKALCNVIYNSQRAQERASDLRLLSGLSERLKEGIHSSSAPSGQFYELRLLFLLTALRPELRKQFQQERGVCMLTAALEQCLAVHWGEVYEVLTDPTAPPVCKDVSQRAIEILKTLFNITYSARRQQPDEEEAAIYRRLAAVLRHCIMLPCDGEDRAEELQGHTVNVLSALPLQCLDVLLAVRLSEGSKESGGVNMDCVHALLMFMEKRLDRGHKLKEKLTPVLNLLTESSKAHRETRHYLRQQILPPLREVSLRPEQGDTVRNRLVRLMTHVDTDVKHCAAELLFVLCKENVRRFVKYTGYGNAAGLLAARGLLSGRGPSPQPQYSSDSDSDTEEYRQAKDRINPVTGRVEEERPDPMEGMTEEEKEAEALKLISMFNRLSRDKIIQPAGVTADGRLAPLCDHMRDRTLEEEDYEEDLEEESEEEDEE